MQVASYPYYLANEPVQGKEQLDVTDKYSGQVAYRVAVASPEEISRCEASGVLVGKACRSPPVRQDSTRAVQATDTPACICALCRQLLWGPLVDRATALYVIAILF